MLLTQENSGMMFETKIKLRRVVIPKLQVGHLLTFLDSLF
jgi:hypothetical protein